jgi:hypothetical protein
MRKRCGYASPAVPRARGWWLGVALRGHFCQHGDSGFVQLVSAPSRFVSEGQDYGFHHWSDGECAHPQHRRPGHR